MSMSWFRESGDDPTQCTDNEREQNLAGQTGSETLCHSGQCPGLHSAETHMSSAG